MNDNNENNVSNNYNNYNSNNEKFNINGSNFNDFVAKYGGATIGGIIALLLCCTKIYKLIFWIIIIAVGMFIGNYVQKNKVSVKEKLKEFIDKF